MNVWDASLWVAFGAVAIAAALELQGLRNERRPWSRYAAWASIAAASLLVAAFLVLCVLFLVLELRYEYVWTYTGTWISWPYRLAGAWTGREGSLLLWTAAMAGVAAVMTVRHQRSTDAPSRRWTRLILLALVAFFALAVARQGTFAPTPDYLLTGRPQGNGINPTLRSPFILIHPPMMFVAYALTIVPASAGIAHLIVGDGLWSRIAGRWAKLNWVLYTFAMGLGGIWAYYTLGFGGYWAWDPVEVANLLPWLALTIYLHAAMAHARRGDMSDVGPMLAVLPFVLTVFSTVSTRSGLWVSVHAFTDPTNAFNPDAAARLLGIMGLDPSLSPYFGILLATLLIAGGLWARRLSIVHGTLPKASRAISGVLAAAGLLALLAPIYFLSAVFEVASWTGSVGYTSLGLLTLALLAAAAPMLVSDKAPERKTRWVSIGGLAIVSVLLLALCLVVAVLWHFGAVNGWSEAFWDARIPWLLTPIALALIVLLLHARWGRVRALQSAAGSFALAIIAGLAGGIGVYAVGLSTFVLAAAGDKMWHVGLHGTRRIKAGSMLLIVAAWLNLVFWLNPPSLILGAFTLRWPIQVPMGALAVVGLLGAHAIGLGNKRPWAYVAVGALGAFYVAPVLAAAAWWLHRGQPLDRPLRAAQVRTVAVYGIHFAVAVLFVGYAASTYFESKVSEELDMGDAVDVGLDQVTLDGVAGDGTPFVERFTVTMADQGRSAAAYLDYEIQTGAYYPLPGTLRTWMGDVYVQVDAICWTDGNACTADDWVTAYESTFPANPNGEAQAARVTVHSLPGLSLVWGALALFVIYGVPVAVLRDKAIRDAPQPAADLA